MYMLFILGRLLYCCVHSSHIIDTMATKVNANKFKDQALGLENPSDHGFQPVDWTEGSRGSVLFGSLNASPFPIPKMPLY